MLNNKRIIKSHPKSKDAKKKEDFRIKIIKNKITITKLTLKAYQRKPFLDLLLATLLPLFFIIPYRN
jgi:hypothetical protein